MASVYFSNLINEYAPECLLIGAGGAAVAYAASIVSPATGFAFMATQHLFSRTITPLTQGIGKGPNFRGIVANVINLTGSNLLSIWSVSLFLGMSVTFSEGILISGGVIFSLAFLKRIDVINENLRPQIPYWLKSN